MKSSFFLKLKKKISNVKENFIYKIRHNTKIIEKFKDYLHYIYVEYELKPKVIWLLKETVDIIITGLLVWYAMPFRNPIINFPGYNFTIYRNIVVQIGLGIALAFYFYEKFIQITKRKYK